MIGEIKPWTGAFCPATTMFWKQLLNE